MRSRSLVSVMAAGVRKGNDFSMVTDARALVGRIHEPFAGAWQHNMELRGPAGLVGYAPLFSIISRISGDIAKLGLQLMVRDDAAGIDRPAPRTSPFWRVLKQPNSYQNRVQFIRRWVTVKLMHGTTHAYKSEFDERGLVTRLDILSPRVTPMVTEDGGVYYTVPGDRLVGLPNGAQAIPSRFIIADRGQCLWNPLLGVPPLVAAALDGSLGLRIKEQSLTFFGNRARPAGYLSAPQKLEPAAAATIKEQWESGSAGANVGRTPVLQGGLEWKSISENAEQAQLAEQAAISAISCATAFNLPAYMVNEGPMPTNNNVQALQQAYYSSTLQTLIEELEECLTQGLLTDQARLDGYTIQVDLDGLLRMDSATQMDFLQKGTRGMILKPNEARARLNLEPTTGGDAVFGQHQDYSLAALAKRDAQPDPFGTAKPPAPAPAPAADIGAEADPEDADAEDADAEEARAFTARLVRELSAELSITT